MKKVIVLISFLFVVFTIKAQEEDQWKPRLHITGYVNTIAEYTDLQNWKDANQHIGIGLSEAAFLVSYRPLKRLEFKGTWVYNHKINDVKDLFVEAYATYTLTEQFKISAGKYLTPLSPVNQYYFAPLNPSATLPMLVSHHFLLPQSILGFQVSGEFGDVLKAGYNITYGGYVIGQHIQQGIIGIVGNEDQAAYDLVGTSGESKTYNLGGSARLYGNYNDIIKIGLNYFDGRRSIVGFQEVDSQTGGIIIHRTSAKKYSFGVDMQLKISNFKINAEYWMGEQKTDTLSQQITMNYKGYYGELIYEKGIFSPYIRYDYVEDAKTSFYGPFPTTILFDAESSASGLTVGVAIRPIYEVLLKAEIRKFNLDYGDNLFNIPIDKYNHIIMSLVYSF